MLQVVQYLRGFVTAGPVLRLSGDGAAVEPVTGVYSPELSPGVMRIVLQKFSRAAAAGLR